MTLPEYASGAADQYLQATAIRAPAEAGRLSQPVIDAALTRCSQGTHEELAGQAMTDGVRRPTRLGRRRAGMVEGVDQAWGRRWVTEDLPSSFGIC